MKLFTLCLSLLSFILTADDYEFFIVAGQSNAALMQKTHTQTLCQRQAKLAQLHHPKGQVFV